MAEHARRIRSRLVAAVLLLGAAAAAGCHRPCDAWDRDGDGTIRLAVLGDSNSYALIPGIWSVQVRHALRKSDPGRWSPKNFARLGACITENDRSVKHGGRFQVGLALAARPPIEVALLAFGTNDFAHGRTPEEIVAAYREAKTRIEAAGARVILATTPPCWAPRCDRDEIARLNGMLAQTFPDVPLVDFSSWVTPEDLRADGVHFTPAGQTKRAAAALAVLRACPGGGEATPAPAPTEPVTRPAAAAPRGAAAAAAAPRRSGRARPHARASD